MAYYEGQCDEIVIMIVILHNIQIKYKLGLAAHSTSQDPPISSNLD